MDTANPVAAVAIYCRVSSETQADRGLGLVCQQDQCKEWLARNPQFTLHKLYIDPGVSGSLERRPALDLLRQDAAAGRFKTLVVSRLDRLSRDLLLLLTLERSLALAGVSIISLAESFGPSGDPAATLMKQVCGAVGQWDRTRLCQRMMEGRKRKLAEGRHASGPAPWGYKITPRHELEVDPASADLVRKVFRWRYGRHSFGWIAARLNADGHKPPKGGKQFYASTIRFILKNSAVYRGFAKYGKLVKGVHDCLI